jgi:nitroimidazol reductase NimA-like FMN-containing flavoprotein (pyridoxamine 5'-phosphate oxidase superfamily)
MANILPVTELNAEFSTEGTNPTPWEDARQLLRDARLYWLSTVRPDGRPHVTPVISIWADGALHFTTGVTERKARNLKQNRHCVLTTGCNSLNEGVDIVVEGDAERVASDAELQRLSDEFVSKYGEHWRFAVRDGYFYHPVGGRAGVYRVAPVTAFGFSKNPFSQTRWRFER